MGDYTRRVTKEQFIEKAENNGWVNVRDKAFLKGFYDYAQKQDIPGLDELMEEIEKTEIWEEEDRRDLLRKLEKECYEKAYVPKDEYNEYGLFGMANYRVNMGQEDIDTARLERGKMSRLDFEKRKMNRDVYNTMMHSGWDFSNKDRSFLKKFGSCTLDAQGKKIVGLTALIRKSVMTYSERREWFTEAKKQFTAIPEEDRTQEQRTALREVEKNLEKLPFLVEAEKMGKKVGGNPNGWRIEEQLVTDIYIGTKGFTLECGDNRMALIRDSFVSRQNLLKEDFKYFKIGDGQRFDHFLTWQLLKETKDIICAQKERTPEMLKVVQTIDQWWKERGKHAEEEEKRIGAVIESKKEEERARIEKEEAEKRRLEEERRKREEEERRLKEIKKAAEEKRTESRKRFDETHPYKGKTAAFMGSLEEMGYNANAFESDLIRLFYEMVRDTGNTDCAALLEQLTASDVHKAEDYRRILGSVIGKAEGLELPEDPEGHKQIEALKRQAAKTKNKLDSLGEPELQKTLDTALAKWQEKQKVKERIKAAEELDKVFVEKAKSMGWKEEDIAILNAITDTQKLIRHKGYEDDKIEALRRKIIETPLPKDKYYTVRNGLLANIQKDAKDYGYIASSVLRKFKMEDVLEKSLPLQKGETHTEDKKSWKEAAFAAGWDKAGDDAFLDIIYEARLDKNVGVDPEYDKILQKFTDPKQVKDQKQEWLIQGMLEQLNDRKNKPELTELQKQAKAELAAQKDAYSHFNKIDRKYFKEEKTKPEEVIYPSYAEHLVLKDVILEHCGSDKDTEKRDKLIKELQDNGISLRQFVYAVESKQLKHAKVLSTISVVPADTMEEVKELLELEVRFPRLTERDKEGVKKAEALLEQWCVEKRKAYTAVDEKSEEELLRSHEEFVAKAVENGWTETRAQDDELVEMLSAARYDKNGKLIPELDTQFCRQYQMKEDFIAERKKLLESYREALRAIPKADRTYRQNAAIKKIDHNIQQCGKGKYLDRREEFYKQVRNTGWSFDANKVRLIYDVLENRLEPEAGELLEEMRVGESRTYPEVRPEWDNGISSLQYLDLLKRINQVISKKPNLMYKQAEETLQKAIYEDIKRWGEEAKAQEAVYKNLATEKQKDWEETYGKQEVILPRYQEAKGNALSNAADSLVRSAKSKPEAAWLMRRLKELDKRWDEYAKAEEGKKETASAALLREAYMTEEALETYLSHTPMKDWPEALMNGIEKLCPEQFTRWDRKAVFVDNLKNKGWEDEDFIENLYGSEHRLDGKDVEEGQQNQPKGSYASTLRKLSSLQENDREEVVECLKKMSQILNGVPEEQRTEAQKKLVNALPQYIQYQEEEIEEHKAYVRQQEREADRQNSNPIEIPFYPPEDIFVPEDGELKPHIWADAKFDYGLRLDKILSQAAADGILLGGDERTQQENVYEDMLTHIKHMGTEPGAERYQEYNGGNFRIRRTKANEAITEQDRDWAEQKLQQAGLFYRKLAWEMQSPELKEYFYGFAFMTETGHGNYTKAVGENPYIAALMSTHAMGPKKSIGIEEAMKGLRGQSQEQLEQPVEQRPESIATEYMAMLNGPIRELALEYERQALERGGWSDPEAEREYLDKLYVNHIRMVRAYEKLSSVEDHGQYNKYLENPLNQMTEQTFDPNYQRGYTVYCGIMDGECRAVDLGFGARDMGIYGMFGAVGGVIERIHKQARHADPRGEVHRQLEAIEELERDFKKLKGDVWYKNAVNIRDKKAIADKIDRFMDKYKDHELLNIEALTEYRTRYEESRIHIAKEYRKSLSAEEYRTGDREIFDRALAGYGKVAEMAKKAESLADRFTELHREDHRDSNAYKLMQKSVEILKAAGMSGSKEQYLEALASIEQRAHDYRDKLGTMDGLVGNGKKRVTLAKDLGKFVKEQRKMLEESFGKEFAGGVPICEQMHKMVKEAPVQKKGNKYARYNYTEAGNHGGKRLKSSLFEIMEADDDATRLVKVEDIERKGRPKTLQQGANRPGNRINVAQLGEAQNEADGIVHHNAPVNQQAAPQAGRGIQNEQGGRGRNQRN